MSTAEIVAIAIIGGFVALHVIGYLYLRYGADGTRRQSKDECYWRHDWEYLQFDHPENIWHRHTKSGLRVCGTGMMEFIHDRVCLRCGRHENQIPSYIEKREAECRRHEERREKARELVS